ncbi:S8 family serine peptidase [Moheibacter sediminis]|uniref:Por secretion system C-terminal sorting domain-containing protein n=1 Tax=Moheibacter sediminis TaxID=1434700 RepID=A0A1W1YI12_9FLAO|nr:S8 family serine peptidase [Moheibacter sediminis]SMC35441.1 Por secretion system C-terminal sorting domain-containing protein [Moheibacter sediminis]
MKTIFTFSLLIISYFAAAQEFVLIRFNDKPSSATYFANPTSMLSQKALDRREKYNIELNMQDVPVEQTYISQVIALGIEPVVISKWFNGIFAELTQTQITQIENLPFVQEVETFVKSNGFQKNENYQVQDKFNVENEVTDFVYGTTEEQITQLSLDYLHNLGFTGEGITIAVLDAGFPGVDVANGFNYLRDNGKIKGGYNFVDDNDSFYTRGSHGTIVLSSIGGYIENQYVGTAIDSDFYLFITEKTEEEIPQEEAWWIAGAERADSIGVDVINTSLGYNEFDDSRYNYQYEDMNGQTAFITRGAQIASEKGIMVVNSAGNAGDSEWHYITAPADGIDIFTIGSVRSNGNPSGFSSYGPTADGRIKPDVSARGSDALVITPDGNIDTASGTSLSSPIMAGAMACFIQAFPEVQPSALRQQVRESASHFNNPTNQLGYGIPDFEKAYNNLLSVSEVSSENSISIYPNPTKGFINVQSDKEIKSLQLISVEGKVIRKNLDSTQIDLNGLPNGIYFLKVELSNGRIQFEKVVKK